MQNGVTQKARPSRAETAAQNARDLIVFADGVEDAGHPELARRSRVVARELLAALDSLAAERSARQQIQRQRDACLQTLANHAGAALGRAA